MGSQIYFYMLAEDEAAFLARVCAPSGVHLIAERSREATPTILSAFPDAGSVAARTGVVLWNRNLAPDIKLRPVTQGYIVEKESAGIVEVTQSELTVEGLTPGRLWCAARAKDRSETAQWYRRIAQILKSDCERQTDGTYLGRFASEWVKDGGKLA